MAPALDKNTRASELVQHYAPHIQGKTILITGASPGGLGESFARQIAVADPAMLILAGRSEEKLQPMVEELHAKHPQVQVQTLSLDLMSFASVRRAAATVLTWTDVLSIDVLVLNAGIMAAPYRRTEDGHESQFQTNHLSHFLFANLVMDKVLVSKARPRIVSVSSNVHRVGHIRWTDPDFDDGKTYQRWLAYGQSKTANALTAVALAQKLSSRGLLAFSLCPGVVMTNLSAHGIQDYDAFSADLTAMDNIYGNKWWPGSDFSGLHIKDFDQGAATHIFAAFDQDLAKDNGAFLLDCHVADQAQEEVYCWAVDKIDAEKLWKLSEKLVGQEFQY